MEFKRELICGVTPHENGKLVCSNCTTCIDCLLSLQGSLELHAEYCEKTQDRLTVRKILEDMLLLTVLPTPKAEETKRKKKKLSGGVKKTPVFSCRNYAGISASMVEDDDFD